MHPFIGRELPTPIFGRHWKRDCCPWSWQRRPADVLSAYAKPYLEQEYSRGPDAERRELHPISGIPSASPTEPWLECLGGSQGMPGRAQWSLPACRRILEDFCWLSVPVFRKRAKRATVTHEKIYLLRRRRFRSLRPKGTLEFRRDRRPGTGKGWSLSILRMGRVFQPLYWTPRCLRRSSR